MRQTSAIFWTLSAILGLAHGDKSFDYVIVGGGTCGLLLANRLSADPDTTVAVIDPGPDRRDNSNVTNPAVWTALLETYVNWGYMSVSQANAGNQSLAYDAGKGIGGTSLINGMTYIRGDKAQFDSWERFGIEGWGWDTMLEYYEKLEKFFEPQPWQTAVGASYERKYHGTEGSLHVGFTPILQEGTLYEAAQKSWAAIGQSLNKDVNSGTLAGFDVWPQTLDPEKNTRWDAATAFYWPVKNRTNLKLLNGTVSRIIWKEGSKSEPEASGVEYLNQADKSTIVEASREVILSAGSLRTPLILELSGVGNPDFLRSKGIETVVASPGVGENLIDQPSNSLIYTGNIVANGTSPYATFATAKDLFGDDFEKIAVDTRGKLSQWAQKTAESGGGALNATAVEALFKIQHDLIFDQDVPMCEILTTASQDKLVSAHWPMMPFARGSVHLRSADDIHTPIIDPKMLSIDFDLTTQIAAGRLSTRFWGSSPINDMVVGQFSPDETTLPPNATDLQWAQWTQGALAPNQHPIGTAAMMAKELGGVVNGEMEVYGAKGLRIVDAAVLPMEVGHLTATLYVVAQRAAEIIIKDRQE